MPSTGFLHDPKAALHHSPTKHYESPLRVAEAYTLLTEKALLSQCRSVRGRAATREELLLAHSAAYIDLLSLTKIDSSKYSSFLPADTFVNADSFDVACFAVGGVVEMTSMVLQGEILNGFALIRPPGHHCETDKPGGFCLLNNVAIAAKYARKQYGIGKIMIVDWDVHHGNGTQEIFYRDAGTLYLSLHRYEHSPGLFYPDAGKADRLGEGGAEGRNINVPFPYTPGGYSDDDYEYIFEEIFLPIANEFSPDLVLVSAGFDAARGDPMGEFNVSPECFGRLTQRMHRFAGGKVILVLEGGYHPQVLGECVVHCMEALLKPTTPPQNSQNFQNLNPLTLQLVQSIKTNLSKYWSTFKSQ
uniref:histone deacetylase n=1 Tax=Arcella intermedia TaxID=1963864 RepID=A0A6B2L631_9EUKA